MTQNNPNIAASDQAIADNKESLQSFLNAYGTSVQIMMALEETGELIQALAKTQRYMKGEQDLDDAIDHLSEEIADVKIMISQIEMIFDNDRKVASYVEQKIARQKDRLVQEIQNSEDVRNDWELAVGRTD